jgi:hypothetical protein
MWRKFKIPIIIVVTALLTQAVGFAVQAAMPGTFLPAGTTRYAVASSTTNELTWSDGWLPILGQTITIPGGKTADIMVIFCGNGWTDSNSTALQVKVQIAGVVASPGEVNFAEQNGVIEGHCAAFYRSGGVAGNVPVRVYWRSTNSAYSVNMYQRSLIVIANIR